MKTCCHLWHSCVCYYSFLFVLFSSREQNNTTVRSDTRKFNIFTVKSKAIGQKRLRGQQEKQILTQQHSGLTVATCCSHRPPVHYQMQFCIRALKFLPERGACSCCYLSLTTTKLHIASCCFKGTSKSCVYLGKIYVNNWSVGGGALTLPEELKEPRSHLSSLSFPRCALKYSS